MRARWLVAKYVPDLRRQEPRNIGVILQYSDAVLCRFRGQRLDGTVDGRRLPRWIRSVTNYKGWTEYWNKTASTLAGEIGELVTRDPSSEYFLDTGGELLASPDEQSPANILEDLYSVLVEEPEEDVASITLLSDRLLNSLEIPRDQLQTNVDFRLKLPDGTLDTIRFHYVYDNGRSNLMQRLSISTSDRSWQQTHAVMWGFEHARQHQLLKDPQMIALVRVRQSEANEERRGAQEQLDLLRSSGDVVNVQDLKAAAQQMRVLLRLS